jgi:hypothetical protein
MPQYYSFHAPEDVCFRPFSYPTAGIPTMPELFSGHISKAWSVLVPLLLAGAMMHAPSIIAMLILSQSPYSAPAMEIF